MKITLSRSKLVQSSYNYSKFGKDRKITSNSLKNCGEFAILCLFEENIEITNFAKVRYLCPNSEK